MSEFTHQSEKFGTVDLMTMYGAQSALQCLGYDPGIADGFDGPKTQAAVKAFQEAMGIGVDGIIGSETRGKLLSEMDAAAVIINDQTTETFSNENS